MLQRRSAQYSEYGTDSLVTLLLCPDRRGPYHCRQKYDRGKSEVSSTLVCTASLDWIKPQIVCDVRFWRGIFLTPVDNN